MHELIFALNAKLDIVTIHTNNYMHMHLDRMEDMFCLPALMEQLHS